MILRHVDSLHMLGVIAMQTNRFEMAVNLISEAIRLKGAVATFHCDLGNALDSLGRYDEAIIAYNEALRLDPNSFDAHNNLGNALINSGKLDEAARQHFERAVEMQAAQCLLPTRIWVMFTERRRCQKSYRVLRKGDQSRS